MRDILQYICLIPTTVTKFLRLGKYNRQKHIDSWFWRLENTTLKGLAPSKGHLAEASQMEGAAPGEGKMTNLSLDDGTSATHRAEVLWPNHFLKVPPPMLL